MNSGLVDPQKNERIIMVGGRLVLRLVRYGTSSWCREEMMIFDCGCRLMKVLPVLKHRLSLV
jgi:hypothetical protein